MEKSDWLQVSPGDWQIWKNLPMTQEVLRAVKLERDELAQRLVEGRSLDRLGGEIVDTARLVGAIYGLDFLLEGIEERLLGQWEELREEEIKKQGKEEVSEYY